jgi:hypothetical protein
MFGPPNRQKYRQAQRSQTKSKGRRQPTEVEDGLAGNLTLTATTVPPLFASSTAGSTPTTREALDRMKFEGSGLVDTPVESQAAGSVHRYVSKESLLTIDDYIPVVGDEAGEPEDAEREEDKIEDVEEEPASKNKEEQRRKKQKQNERRRNRNKNRNKKKGQRQEQANAGKSIPAEPAT